MSQTFRSESLQMQEKLSKQNAMLRQKLIETQQQLENGMKSMPATKQLKRTKSIPKKQDDAPRSLSQQPLQDVVLPPPKLPRYKIPTTQMTSSAIHFDKPDINQQIGDKIIKSLQQEIKRLQSNQSNVLLLEEQRESCFQLNSRCIELEFELEKVGVAKEKLQELLSLGKISQEAYDELYQILK